MKITFDPTKIKKVPLSEVRPNTWNPKDKDTKEFKRLVESIKLNGFIQPIIVRQNNGYEIIDGEQRYTAQQFLNEPEVWIYDAGVVPDEQAKAKTLWMQIQVPMNEIMLAKLLIEIPQIDVPFDPIERQRYQELGNFDWNQYNASKGQSDDDHSVTQALKIVCTEEQHIAITDAIRHVQSKGSCSDGRALELICADYMAGQE